MAAASVALLLVIGKLPGQSTPEGVLLNDFNKFLKEVIDPKTKAKLSSNCENQPKFAEQIRDLEKQLEELRERKNEILDSLNPPKKNDGSEPLELSDGDYSDALPGGTPGSEPLELSDGDYSDVSPEVSLGSEPLELSDGDYSDVSPEDSLGSEPLELSDGDYSDVSPEDSLGSEPLELSDGDYSDVSPEDSLGSEPLELSDGDYSDALPGGAPGSEPLELSDGDYSDALPEKMLDEIEALEKKIMAEINNLKSLCDKEEEIISTSCPSACQKYADCTIYTEGTTKEDQKDAYDSCMEECPKWSDKTKICINKRPIKGIDDCIHLSFCGLAEYNNVR